MRTTLAVLALLFLVAGTAAAQIAAPSLIPVPSFTNAPGNPAVLSWDGPSRVGLGYGDAKLEDPPPNGPGDGNVLAARAQYVGETFSAGVGWDQLSLALPAGSLDVDASALQLSGRVGDWLSVGISHEAAKRTDPGGTLDVTASTLGAVVRVGVFYVGANSGSVDVEKAGVSQGTDVTRYGLAYLWQDKSGGLHVELAHDSQARIASFEDGTSNNLVNVEARFGSVALGYLSQSREVEDAASGAVTGEQDLETLTVAWVPEQGLAFALAHSTLQGSGVSGGPQSLKFTSLGVSWLY